MRIRRVVTQSVRKCPSVGGRVRAASLAFQRLMLQRTVRPRAMHDPSPVLRTQGSSGVG